MNSWKRLYLRFRARAGRMRRVRVWTIAALATVALSAVVWLAASAGPAAYRPLSDTPMSAVDRAAAQILLAENNIPVRVESNRLLVPADQLARAQTLLAKRGMDDKPPVSELQQFAGQNDIWSSQAQRDKRWQVAKMAALSRLISEFAPVRSATVLYEPGRPRRLGAPGEPATAAVRVSLKDGQPMTDKLVAAIADLVAGSVAGLDRSDVRIVDDSGRSYRASAETSPSALVAVQTAETFYTDKISRALGDIPGLSIAVSVAFNAEGVHCRSASVSVPQSYFERLAGPRGADMTSGQFAAEIQPRLDAMRTTVARAVGTETRDIQVDWYLDDSPVASMPPKTVTPPSSSEGRGLAAGLLIALGISAGVAWGVRRRMKPASVVDTDDVPHRVFDADAPFAFLAQADAEELIEFLEGEHPQTAALILSHLEADQAAAVLAALPRGQQADISRRIAELAQADPRVVRQAERVIAERLAAVATEQVGGVGAVSDILQRAGGRTERAVLNALDDAEPSLAETIRQRMFAFEDLAAVPVTHLRAAMETLDSDELAIALRTAGDKLTKKLLSALSAPFARDVRDAMTRIGPVRLSDVEAAQQRVLDVVRRMEQGAYVSDTQSRRNTETQEQVEA